MSCKYTYVKSLKIKRNGIGLIPMAGTELRSPVSVIDRLLLLETTVFVLVVSENIPNVFKELSEQRER